MAKNKTNGGRLKTRIRHLKLAGALIEGKNYREAVLAAGYTKLTSERDSAKIVKSAHATIQEVMVAAGITPEFKAKKLLDLANAKQYRPITRRTPKGDVVETWEAPDPRTQGQTMELITEIQGDRRWGLPGENVGAIGVQVNVSFGDGTQGAATGGKAALPVDVKVVKIAGAVPLDEVEEEGKEPPSVDAEFEVEEEGDEDKAD